MSCWVLGWTRSRTGIATSSPACACLKSTVPRPKHGNASCSARRIALPGEMAFLPVNFDRQILREELQAAGFQCDRPAFFSWLGVTVYLTHQAFTATMQFIRSMPPSSGVAFDYAVARSLLSFLERVAMEGLTLRVGAVPPLLRAARAGERVCGDRISPAGRPEPRGNQCEVFRGSRRRTSGNQQHRRLMSAWGKGLE
jgi:O-methyltransferase involved in polyketide biosynthesis